MTRARIVWTVGSFISLLLVTIAATHAKVATAAPARDVSGWEVVTVDTAVDTDDVQIGVVTCPLGKQVLGGGYLLHTSVSPIGDDLRRIAVVDSHPFPGHPVADSWRVRAVRIPPAKGPWNMRIYAICAFVSL